MLGQDEAAGKAQWRRFDLNFGDGDVAVFVAPGLSSILKSGAMKRRAWMLLRSAAAHMLGGLGG